MALHTNSGVYLELARQLPGQLSYFIAGAFLYYYLPIFANQIHYFLSGAMLVLLIDQVFHLAPFEPFAIAIIVIFFGLFFYVGNFGKYGDFSYGIYIMHFPVIQIILHSGFFQERPWHYLVISIFITTTSAIILWHMVEKRFLIRSSHYIITTKPKRVLPNSQRIDPTNA